jgi:hypothetical protein
MFAGGSAELMSFECISCLATYTGKPHELDRIGWTRHRYEARVAPKRGEILLCESCEAFYTQLWKAHAEAKEAA